MTIASDPSIAGMGSPAMEVDDDDSYVVPPEHAGCDPLDLAPRSGETAYLLRFVRGIV